MTSLKVFTVSTFTAVTSWYCYKNFRLKADENYLGPSEDLNLKTPARIAVIGTGIGGSSASFFLRKSFGSSVIIDAYEKSDRIGGRLRTIKLNEDDEVEAGGTIIHDSNNYMVEFTKELGLERFKDLDYSVLGVYNGTDFVYLGSHYEFVEAAKMLWRYGLWSIWSLKSSLTSMLNEFQNIYKVQNSGQAFSTMEDLLRAQGGERFLEYTQRTARDIMRENGLSDLLIDELVTGIARCNYGQDSNVNAFTGYVSLAGSMGSLWSVKNGNYLVCKKLLETANVNVSFNEAVKNIRKESINGKPAYFIDTGNGKESEKYDVVIIAAPLEVPSCYLKCNGCSSWPTQDSLGKYQQTVATFVQANINFKKFGFKELKETPDVIFTTENKNLSFSCVGSLRNIKGDIIEPPVYKVFSREPLTKESLHILFDLNVTTNKTKSKSVNWLAYPHYTTPEKFTPFVLDEGIFYVNCIERAASAMEMSAIGGRNAALLTKNYLMANIGVDDNKV